MTPFMKVNKAARNAAAQRINLLWKQLVREIEWAIYREAVGPTFSATHIIISPDNPKGAVGVMMATAPMPRDQMHDMLARAQAQFGRPEIRVPAGNDDEASD